MRSLLPRGLFRASLLLALTFTPYTIASSETAAYEEEEPNRTWARVDIYSDPWGADVWIDDNGRQYLGKTQKDELVTILWFFRIKIGTEAPVTLSLPYDSPTGRKNSQYSRYYTFTARKRGYHESPPESIRVFFKYDSKQQAESNPRKVKIHLEWIDPFRP